MKSSNRMAEQILESAARGDVRVGTDEEGRTVLGIVPETGDEDAVIPVAYLVPRPIVVRMPRKAVA